MITIHIPQGKNAPSITKELSSAKNIKDRVIRNNTITGLNKINSYL